MYKFLFILLLSFSITQEPCEGTCFSEEEVLNITNNIKELQFDVEKYKEIEDNLNLQIKDYMKNDSLNISLINNAEVVARTKATKFDNQLDSISTSLNNFMKSLENE